jgi:hypothetical protein
VKESEAINSPKPKAIKKVAFTKSTTCFLIIEFVTPKESHMVEVQIESQIMSK